MKPAKQAKDGTSLRRLERNDLVARRIVSLSPVAVEYRITPLGRTLLPPFLALYRWTVDSLPAVEEARGRFYARGDALPEALVA